jgi:hypothetical protein
MDRRQIGLLGLTEEVTDDLVAWGLLPPGFAFGHAPLLGVQVETHVPLLQVWPAAQQVAVL